MSYHVCFLPVIGNTKNHPLAKGLTSELSYHEPEAKLSHVGNKFRSLYLFLQIGVLPPEKRLNSKGRHEKKSRKKYANNGFYRVKAGRSAEPKPGDLLIQQSICANKANVSVTG